MEIQLPQMHATELRVRQTMIEHEQDSLERLTKQLSHENEITYQFESTLLLLSNQHLQDSYHDDYVARVRLLKIQRKRVRKLRKHVEFLRLRIEAMTEAISFYLVEHFAIDPSLPWTLDIDNECLREGVGPIPVS